jgi:hypothetical protein
LYESGIAPCSMTAAPAAWLHGLAVSFTGQEARGILNIRSIAACGEIA